MKNQGREAHVTCLHIDWKTYSVHKNDFSGRNSPAVINNYFSYLEFFFHLLNYVKFFVIVVLGFRS